jgi:hypothetical protein
MVKFTSVILLIIGVCFGVVSAMQSASVGNAVLDVSQQAHILLMWVIQALVVAALIKYLFE